VDLLNNCDKDHTFRENEVKTFFLNKDKNPYAILEGVRDKLGKAYRFFVCTVFALNLQETKISDISTQKEKEKKEKKEEDHQTAMEATAWTRLKRKVGCI